MLFRFSYAAEVALIYDTALCSMHDKSHKGLLVGLFVARVPLNGKSHPPSRMKGLFETGVLHQADYKKVADFRDYPGKLLLRDNYRLHRNSWRSRREPIDDRGRRNSSGRRATTGRRGGAFLHAWLDKTCKTCLKPHGRVHAN